MLNPQRNISTFTSIEKRYEELIVVLLPTIIIHILFISGIILEESVLDGLVYITGTIIGIGFVYYLITFGEELRDRIRTLSIATISVILLVTIIHLYIEVDIIFGVLGFIPSFLLLFTKITPYRIDYTLRQNGKGYIMTKDTHYLIGHTHIQRELAKNTEYRLRVEDRGLSTLGSNSSYNLLYFNDIENMHDPIEFAPLNIRGLVILGKLLQIVPAHARVTTNSLDRMAGGLLSSLEPKVSNVDIRMDEIPKSSDVSSIIDEIRNNNLKKIIIPSKKTLTLLILWGIIISTLIGLFTSIILVFTYLAVIETEITLVVIFAIFSLIMLLFLLYSMNEIVISPMAILLGKLRITANEEYIIVYYSLGPFKSHKYLIPTILQPQMINDNGVYFITCNDTTKEYYRLPLGRLVT